MSGEGETEAVDWGEEDWGEEAEEDSEEEEAEGWVAEAVADSGEAAGASRHTGCRSPCLNTARIHTCRNRQECTRTQRYTYPSPSSQRRNTSHHTTRCS